MNYDKDITYSLTLLALFVMGFGMLSTMLGVFVVKGWVLPIYCAGNVIMLLNAIHFIKVCICKAIYLKRKAKKDAAIKETIF